MALVNMRDLVYHAYDNNYAVGAFDLVNLEFLEAVVDAAERCRASIILSIAEPQFAHYDYALLLPAIEAAANRASIPVAIQLDHGRSLQSAVNAINLGCNGVTLDASSQQLPDNIRATGAVVERAHGCGVPVAGELGYVAGHEGEGAEMHPGETSLTIPSEARAYVERTGVDFLAVSIGTVQGRMKGRAKLDYPRLKQLNSALNIPLVIHGGSGLNEDQFRKLTSYGIAKINYYTALSDIAAKAMRQHTRSNPGGSCIDIQKDVKNAISAEVERCLRLWGCAGRAAEVIAQCEPWSPVEHLIVHNVNKRQEQQFNEMLAEGKRLLSGIPGVREVFAGQAVKQSDRYGFCWLVRFTHKKVIHTYRDHPNFAAFSKKYFQPYASDILSIDYQG